MRILLIFILCCATYSGSIKAQGPDTGTGQLQDTVLYQDQFRIAAGADVEYTTPQKYGAGAGLYIGKYAGKLNVYQGSTIRTSYSFKGVNPHVKLTRGGYQLGLYYFDLVSFVAPAGVKIGPVYYANNSYSSVFKRNDLIGIEAEYYLIFKIKAGVLKEIEGNRFLPVVGFGIPIGPNMYKAF